MGEQIEEMVWIAATHRNYDLAIGDATDLEFRKRIAAMLGPRSESSATRLSLLPLSQQEHISYEPRSVAIRPDSNALMVGTKSGTLHLYEFEPVSQTFVPTSSASFPSADALTDGHGAIRGCCFLGGDLVVFIMGDTLELHQRSSPSRPFEQLWRVDLSSDPTKKPRADAKLGAAGPREVDELSHATDDVGDTKFGTVRNLIPLTEAETATYQEVLVLYNGLPPQTLRFERSVQGQPPTPRTLSPSVCPLCGYEMTPTAVDESSTSQAVAELSLVDAAWRIEQGMRTSLYGLFDSGELKRRGVPTEADYCGCDVLKSFGSEPRYHRLAVRGPYAALMSDHEVCVMSVEEPSIGCGTYSITKPLRHDIWFPRFLPTKPENVVWVYVSSVGRGVETIGFNLDGAKFESIKSRSPRHPRQTGSVLQLGIIEASAESPILFRATQDHELLFSSILDKTLLKKCINEHLIRYIKSVIEPQGIIEQHGKPPVATPSAWKLLGTHQSKLLCGPVAWVCLFEMLREEFRGAASSIATKNARWNRAEILGVLEAEDLRRFTNTIFVEVGRRADKGGSSHAYAKITDSVLDWTHSLLERARTISNDLEIEVANLIMNQIWSLQGGHWNRLRAFADFIRKWIDRGYTYAQKQKRHLDLYRWNKNCRHHLDALCYLSYLRHSRFDLLWEEPLHEWEGDVSSWAVEHTQVRDSKSQTKDAKSEQQDVKAQDVKEQGVKLEQQSAQPRVDVFFQSSADGSLRAVRLTNPSGSSGPLPRVLGWEIDAHAKAAAELCFDNRDGRCIRRLRWEEFYDHYQHGPFTRAIAIAEVQTNPEFERLVVIAWQGWRKGDREDAESVGPVLVALRICIVGDCIRVVAAAHRNLETELFCFAALPRDGNSPTCKFLAGTSGQLRASAHSPTGGEWQRIPLLEFDVDPTTASISEFTRVGGSDHEGQRSYVRTGDHSPGVTVDPCTSLALSPPTDTEQRLWASFRDGEIRSYVRELKGEGDKKVWSKWIPQPSARLNARSRIVRLQYFAKGETDKSSEDGILCYGTLDGVFGAMKFTGDSSIHILHAKEQSTITGVFQFSQDTDTSYLAYLTHSGAISIFRWHKGSEQGSLRRTGRIQLGVSSWHGVQIMIPDYAANDGVDEGARRPAIVVGCDDGALRALDLLLIHDPLVPESKSRADIWKTDARELFRSAKATDLTMLARAHMDENERSHDYLAWLPLLRIGSQSLTVFAFEGQLERMREWMTPTGLSDSAEADLTDEFNKMKGVLKRIERDAVLIRPVDIGPAKVIWSLMGAACQTLAQAAWDCYWKGNRARSEFLIEQYQDLVSTLEVYCNQWIGRDFTEKSEILNHSFQAVFSKYDVLMLAWRSPGRSNSSLRDRMVLSILARRLHFSLEQVPIETLRVLNDAIEDSIVLLHTKLFDKPADDPSSPPCHVVLANAISLRPADVAAGGEQVENNGLPKWAELENSGFYDLMTVVGDVARSRLTAHEHTDPFHTGIARFFGLCLVMFPHAALNISQVIAESRLLRQNNLTFVGYVRKQANATLRRIDTGKMPAALKSFILEKLDLVGEFLSPHAHKRDKEDGVDHVKTIAALAEKAKENAAAFYLSQTGKNFILRESDKYRWDVDIARWTRPFSDDALVLEYHRVLVIICSLDQHENAKKGPEYGYCIGWAEATNKGRRSRYFPHSCQFLVEKMVPALENIRHTLESRKSGATEAAEKSAIELRDSLAHADMFEPELIQYDSIISGWMATIGQIATNGSQLYEFFERINRHVYRVGSDDAMAAIVELVLQRMPTLYDENTDKQGSITSVLEERLGEMPEAWVIRDVFKYCHQLVQQTHMTGMLLSVSRELVFRGFGGGGEDPDNINAKLFKERLEEAGRLCSLEVAFVNGAVPADLHLNGFELVWKVILDEFVTNVAKYGTRPVDPRKRKARKRKAEVYCQIERSASARTWTVRLAGNRPFADHVSDPLPWDNSDKIAEFIRTRVMEFGRSAGAVKESSGVGMALIEKVGKYVNLEVNACLRELRPGLASSDLKRLPLCLEIISHY